jgi:hypothetical protein
MLRIDGKEMPWRSEETIAVEKTNAAGQPAR